MMIILMEEWKIIYIDGKTFHYEVSNLGRIRNVKRLTWKTKGILTPKFNKQNGYCSVGMGLNGEIYYKYIHRLVAEAFLENKEDLPQVNHKDGNKLNNIKNNLEWISSEGNMKHAFDNSLVEGTQKHVLIYSIQGEFIKEYVSISEAIRQVAPNKDYKTLGINQSALFNPLFQMYGYQWRLKGSDVPVNNIEETYHGIKGVVQLDAEGKFIKEYDSVSDACREFKILNNGDINRVCKNIKKECRGFIWKYKSDYYKEKI